MTDFKTMHIQDIPENIGKELERLHLYLEADAPNDLAKWAQRKIDDIHKTWFHPAWLVGDKND